MTNLALPTRGHARVEEIIASKLEGTWDRESAEACALTHNVHLNVVQTEARIIDRVLDVLYDARGKVERAIDDQLQAVTDIAADMHQRTAESGNPNPGWLGNAIRALDSRKKSLGLQKQKSAEVAADQRAARKQLAEQLRDPELWFAELLADAGWVRLDSP